MYMEKSLWLLALLLMGSGKHFNDGARGRYSHADKCSVEQLAHNT